MPRAGAVAVAVLAVFLGLSGCGGGGGDGDRERAVSAALDAFAEVRNTGLDLARGPCIAERLSDLPDWVADVAHDPRRPVDELARNQCARYRAGEAHHFVELTPVGALIGAQ